MTGTPGHFLEKCGDTEGGKTGDGYAAVEGCEDPAGRDSRSAERERIAQDKHGAGLIDEGIEGIGLPRTQLFTVP